jgi:two-component system invasion response regulator UvrY
MQQSKIKVACADDHNLVREGIVSFINNFSACLVTMTAENGLELMDKLSVPGAILPDVAILDVSMPVLNGYETTLSIRKQFPAIKIIALSMFDNEISVLMMLKNGANGYLHKNCRPCELLAAITNVHTLVTNKSNLSQKWQDLSRINIV